MIDRTALTEAVEIQQRSYRLIQWLAQAISRGFIRFDRAHRFASEAEAAAHWFGEHLENFPPDARPPDPSPEGLQKFANFFSSYLQASFDLDGTRGQRADLRSTGGCYCSWCTRLVAASHLRAKKLKSEDKKKARKMKRTALEQLSLDLKLPAGSVDLDARIDQDSFSRPVALYTYGVDLLQRCAGAAAGPATLALWRQFAWTRQGAPDRKFQLTADGIFAAREEVARALVPSDSEDER